ncbi:Rieske (2Fe-2S) domain-containing protein [Sphingobium herbicidovorans NBRC 16415]|uniref:Rieske (2Fe-2S) domain-containing protein n=1 Tax=Sphingobium herbicidovorans (strain ATCC 700291 / DSM 11019 / CCUG 56400 / KCTC 2939 / LMG 18315 / NBRC 16415 / MH) TaxID=1219045 RepID=A0A086PBZ8_SPHHM|nr:aromatic ring-hydroxylating dioxygenase subunit alpha [Sphingobium herbicidovorans]KFG90916.1 Rieske (2Fe-2S) domain-containing protein [Sphingobium herbicidovorans NBRC 16415]
MSRFTGRMGQAGVMPIDPWTPNYEQAPGVAGGQEKQPYIDFGTDRLSDNEKYYSSDVLAKEWDKLLSKAWIVCGHINDIPEEHCYMKVDYGRESILIIRGEGDDIRAFYNVCQHRGTRIVKDDFGKARSFTCPYHAWSFTNDGKLAHLPGRETFREEVLCRNLDLEPVRVDQWKGWIFFSLDPNVGPLDDYLGERFRASVGAYDFRNFVRVYDVRQTWTTNWKASIEAFIEGYHVSSVHSATLTPVMDDYYTQHDMYENGHGRTIFPFMEPAQSYLRSVDGKVEGINEEMKLFLKAAGVPEDDYPTKWQDVKAAVIKGKRENQAKLGFDFSGFSDDQLVDDWNMSMFPLATFNAHPEGVLFQRWWPDEEDPRKTHYSLQIYAMRGECVIPSYMPIHPDADREGKKVLQPMYLEGMGSEALGPVVMEDVAFVPQFQKGIESRGFRGANYGEQEVRNRQFYHEYYRYMNGARNA